MGASDALFVGVSKNNRTSAATADLDASDQSKASAFLTVQSFTNFAAATGAITTAWLALQALDVARFQARTWPFLLAVAWLLVSFISSLQVDSGNRRNAAFWVSGLFLGFMNTLTLFAAVIGVSAVVPD